MRWTTRSAVVLAVLLSAGIPLFPPAGMAGVAAAGEVLGTEAQAAPAAPAGVRVLVGDAEVTFPLPPVWEQGSLLVPVRALGEALGAQVQWQPGEPPRAVLRRAARTVTLRPGDNALLVEAYPRDGDLVPVTWTVRLTVAPRIVGGMLLAPLRELANGLGIEEILSEEGGFRLSPYVGWASLRVESEPAGAWVRVVEVPGTLCRAPCTIGNLREGVYALRVEAPGYERWAGDVSLRRGANRLAVSLVAGNRGKLTVLSEPAGDRVWLDGVELGRAPLRDLPVAPGPHRIRVSRGGRSWEGTVRVFPASPSSGMAALDLTVVVVNLDEGWSAVRYPSLSWHYPGRGSPAGWTPDGRRVALAASGSPDPNSQGPGVWLLDPERVDAPEAFLAGEDVWSFAGWAPDGRRLAFANGAGLVVTEGGTGSPGGTIHRYSWSDLKPPADATGSGPAVLRWLPDGRVLGVVEGEWVAHFWTFDPAAGRLSPLGLPPSCPGAACGNLVFRPVDWLPDGRTALAELRSYRRKDGTAEYTTSGYFADLALVDTATGAWRRLTDAPEGTFFEPLALVDGRSRAAYRLWEQDAVPAGRDVWERPWHAYGTIVLSPRAGDSPRDAEDEDRVLTAPGEAAWISWSPRGETVLYGTADGAVLAMNPDGTGKRLLFHLPHASLSRALDGRRSRLSPGPWSPLGDRLWLWTDIDGEVWFLFRSG